MIVNITGLPGNGKTLYALQYVKAWAEREGREVWYHGIKDLALPWHKLPTKTETVNGREVEVPQWWLCPAKSIIIVDEAQMCGFGVRPRGVVPEWGQKLETHRHLGLDLVLITQSPTLLDAHDRALCELHFHVVRTFGMQRAVVHEFRPVRENVLKSRAGSIEHRWSYPKEVFKWYTSAEAHTHKRRIPMRVWVFASLPFVIGGVGWYTWHNYLDPRRFERLRAEQGIVPAGAASAPGLRPAGNARGDAKLTKAEWIEQFQPRLEGLAYSAPVYDEVTKPVVAPYPAAAVANAKECRAYSQQATRLDMPDEMCRRLAAGGFFIGWQQPTVQAGPVALRPPDAVQGQVQPSAGTSYSLGGSRTSHFTGQTASAGGAQVTGVVEQSPRR